MEGQSALTTEFYHGKIIKEEAQRTHQEMQNRERRLGGETNPRMEN